MSAAGIIADWVTALAEGERGRAAGQLSPAFGIHEGMDAEAYLAHEIEEFRIRREGFGLTRRPEIVVRDVGEGRHEVVVLTPRGDLAYEDMLTVAGGRIVGNGRPVEAVSKLSFDFGRPCPRHAMAIRGHGAAVRAVTPLFPVADFSFQPSTTHGIDGFSLVTFDGEAPFRGRSRPFRAILGSRGVSFEVFMRGIDHRFFRGDRFPEIEGRYVRIDLGPGPVWSLTATLEDGSVRVVDCPAAERIEFPAAVVAATITDAIDNDWTVGAGRSW